MVSNCSDTGMKVYNNHKSWASTPIGQHISLTEALPPQKKKKEEEKNMPGKFGIIDPNVGGWGQVVPNFYKSLLLWHIWHLFY